MPGKFVLSKLSGIIIIAFFYIISYLLGPFYTVGIVEGVRGCFNDLPLDCKCVVPLLHQNTCLY